MKWLVGTILIALLSAVVLIHAFDSKNTRYALAERYQIPALSIAKRCDAAKLTVEQHLVDQFRGTYASKVCVERTNSSVRIVPDHAVIRKLRFGTGYQLAIIFSSPASEWVSRTIRDSIHNDVVVYRDRTVIDTFYPLDGEFQNEVYFWFREREDVEVAMDKVRGVSLGKQLAKTP